MAVIAHKRSVMTLYSSPVSPFSHSTRLVLSEKGITVEIHDVHEDRYPEDLRDINPYGEIPTLVDRGLVLYRTHIINEYLDERFPHPPLMPVDPVLRATARIALYRVYKDWYEQLVRMNSGDTRLAMKARKQLRETIVSSASLFAAKPFFMSDEFSLVDCAVAPVLWRLPYYKIDLPRQAKPVAEYAARIFTRGSFRSSLTEAELEMKVK